MDIGVGIHKRERKWYNSAARVILYIIRIWSIWLLRFDKLSFDYNVHRLCKTSQWQHNEWQDACIATMYRHEKIELDVAFSSSSDIRSGGQ